MASTATSTMWVDWTSSKIVSFVKMFRLYELRVQLKLQCMQICDIQYGVYWSFYHSCLWFLNRFRLRHDIEIYDKYDEVFLDVSITTALSSEKLNQLSHFDVDGSRRFKMFGVASVTAFVFGIFAVLIVECLQFCSVQQKGCYGSEASWGTCSNVKSGVRSRTQGSDFASSSSI